MEIAITGASGYVGQHLAAELHSRGQSLRAIVRPGVPDRDMSVLAGMKAKIYSGQFGQDNSSTGSTTLAEAFEGADCAIHLIGSVAPPKGGPDYEELHSSYTSHFADACVAAGIKKAVLVTALGANENSQSQYLAAKKRAELAFVERLENAGVSATVVRPSLIVGRQVGCRDSKLVERYRIILKTRPIVPLVGGGLNMLEPVFIGDLAFALATILMEGQLYKPGASQQKSAERARLVEIGGPQKLSMRQFVEALAASMSISKPLITLPYAVASLAAGVLGKLQEVPLLSPDQVKLAAEDMVCQANSLPQLLAPKLPTTLNQALLTYQAGAAGQ